MTPAMDRASTMSPWSAHGAGAVASADQRATAAGVAILAMGGNAADAALATNAVMAVVAPHLCGLGGDLFALVSVDGTTHALNGSGRGGSGSDATQLRAEGFRGMPFRHDVRSVTVPGCVDGWVALHERFGSISLDDLLAPAMALAQDGMLPSVPLIDAVRSLPTGVLPAMADARVGETLRLPGVARSLQRIGAEGRSGFYGGEFGAGLIKLGSGLFSSDDLKKSQADWVTPLSANVFGVELHTMPPNSQGYLTLGAALLAEQVDLPDDPDDPLWAHLLIECAKAAGFDRPQVLSEYADGAALLAAISNRFDSIDRNKAHVRTLPSAAGDTTYLCVIDEQGMGVSLIQSNAAGFGSLLAEPNTGINLHNRGMGFSLEVGHSAELGPGRRPPHTLSPALATRDGRLAAVLGTMGGDAQPQILLQLAARLFLHEQTPERAITAGRWRLEGPSTGFDTWGGDALPRVVIEGHAASEWNGSLELRGHAVSRTPPYDAGFGHAHAIVIEPDGSVSGCADPRTQVGSCDAV